jgi:hypothetical protein
MGQTDVGPVWSRYLLLARLIERGDADGQATQSFFRQPPSRLSTATVGESLSGSESSPRWLGFESGHARAISRISSISLASLLTKPIDHSMLLSWPAPGATISCRGPSLELIDSYVVEEGEPSIRRWCSLLEGLESL